MTTFWFFAVLLVSVACAFLFLPLWWYKQRENRWSVAGLVALIAIVPVAALLYLQVTNWNPQTPSSALPAVTEMVANLARRLQSNPDDPIGWQMLGRSYVALGQYPDALRAYREAWARTREPNNELKLGLGEAEVLNDRSMLGGEAGRLFEEVLTSEPDNMKALWYGGLAALEGNRTDLARERWSRLMQLNPPAGVAQMLQEQLGGLGVQVAQTAPAGAQPRAAAPAPTAAAAASGPSIRLQVHLGEGVKPAALGPQAALFIFARAPGGGPPVAVLRERADAVPGTFSLSDANAMIPGRSLGDFEVLTLVARISASGQPMGSQGDLYGQIEYRPASDPGSVEIVIDQVQ
jgi:cytochrome c-type biogenesis protein CcmH